MSKLGAARRQTAYDEAMACTQNSRMEVYGDAEEHFRTLTDMFNLVFSDKIGAKLTSLQITMLFEMSKMLRSAQSPLHRDSHIDRIGYAAISAGIAQSMVDDPDNVD